MRDGIRVELVVTVYEVTGWTGDQIAQRSVEVAGSWPALRSLKLGDSFQCAYLDALAAAREAQEEAQQDGGPELSI